MIDACPHCFRSFAEPISADEASKLAEQLRVERDVWRAEFKELCANRMEIINERYLNDLRFEDLTKLLLETREYVLHSSMFMHEVEGRAKNEITKKQIEESTALKEALGMMKRDGIAAADLLLRVDDYLLGLKKKKRKNKNENR